MTRYRITLIDVRNEKTNTVRYYKSVCGNEQRISKDEFDDLRDSCTGMESIHSDTQMMLRRNYRTCIFEL